jgi:hypothetical protein
MGVATLNASVHKTCMNVTLKEPEEPREQKEPGELRELEEPREPEEPRELCLSRVLCASCINNNGKI